MNIRILLIAFISFALVLNGFAQGEPIGQWRSHMPYNRGVSLASDGQTIFVACRYGFFTYHLLSEEINTYAKSNGMSDVEMAYIAHDNITNMTVMAYVNSNIDLFKDNTFYNIPDLKLKNIAGDKSIYNIFIEDGFAYLSTGIGVIVVNLSKKEIKETFVFGDGTKNFAVKGFCADTSFYYAATDNGLFKSPKTNPRLQTSASWTRLEKQRKYSFITNSLNKVFVSTNDSVFVVQKDSLAFVFALDSSKINHLDPIEKGLAIATFNAFKGGGKIFIIDNALKTIDSISAARPLQTLSTSDQTIWIADAYAGLKSSNKNIIPNGPYSASTFDIIAENGSLNIAHGSYDDKWIIQYNRDGLSCFENGQWSAYNSFLFSSFNNLHDAIRLAKDPRDGTVYIASQTDGLFFLKKDKTGGQIKEGVFEKHIVDPSTYRLSGAAFDRDNNLWITQSNAPNELMAKSAKDGSWYKFGLPFTRPRPSMENGAAGLIIDDNNLKWFFSPVGGGVLVYDDKGTLENPNDDEYTRLTSGKGSGNLPDNIVQCIVNDKKGTIWIGTANGIGIINCPESVIAGQCETEIRVVQYDKFAGELFAGENVKTIAVDGANRKWVGTTNGVWLISEDANKIMSRFTMDNSPLPSNIIQVIKVDPVTGDVYFGTDKGLVSYRGTAVDGGETNTDVLIFPNPVTHDYSGPIAIRGLVENADVRITDISGQLIYRGKALGGQAIWNGTDYTGRRPQTGVFLVFASNNLGTEKYVGKLVFVK
jgi:ligand-binding sensor domain-containing protein